MKSRYIDPRLISLKCPSCGSTMNFSEKKESVICEYCGNKFLVVDLLPNEKEERSVMKASNRLRKGLYISVLLTAFFVIMLGLSIFMKSHASDELKEIDPFDYITINYKGVSGNATATIDKNFPSSSLNNLSIDISKSKKLENGDKITVKINTSDMIIKQSNYKFSTKSKEYLVNELNEYVTDLSQINENSLKAFDTTSYNKLVDNELGLGNYEKKVDWNRVGMYLLNDKETKESRLYQVFSVTFSDNKGNMGNFYNYVYYDDIQITKDGIIDTSYKPIGKYNYIYPFSGSHYWINAYSSEKALFIDTVKSVEADYDYKATNNIYIE